MHRNWWSRGDGIGDDALAKMGELGADWRDEHRSFTKSNEYPFTVISSFT